MGSQFKTKTEAASIDLTGVHTGDNAHFFPLLRLPINLGLESAFKLLWMSNL